MKERNKYRKEAIEFFNSDSQSKSKKKSPPESERPQTSRVVSECPEDLISDEKLVAETSETIDSLLLKHEISQELEAKVLLYIQQAKSQNLLNQRGSNSIQLIPKAGLNEFTHYFSVKNKAIAVMESIQKPVFLEEPEQLLHPKLICEQYKSLLVEIKNEQFGF